MRTARHAQVWVRLTGRSEGGRREEEHPDPAVPEVDGVGVGPGDERVERLETWPAPPGGAALLEVLVAEVGVEPRQAVERHEDEGRHGAGHGQPRRENGA